MLYKYRGLSNIEFALDIFVNQRLYAAKFETLNDPMEGIFLYRNCTLELEDLKKIRGAKSEYNILSLSETPNNMLMWSYYSEGHSGFVVGVSIEDTNASVTPVEYVPNLKLEDIHSGMDIAKTVLTRKLDHGKHEEEHRAFIHQGKYVKVLPKELVFGLKTPTDKKELLTVIAEKFCPDISVRSIRKSEMDKGVINDNEI